MLKIQGLIPMEASLSLALSYLMAGGRCKSLTQVRGGIVFNNIIRLSSTK